MRAARRREVETIAKQEFPAVVRQAAGDESQRARQIEIVGVEPAQNASRRQRRNLCSGVGLATIFFTFPVRQVAFVFFYDLDTIVCAPTSMMMYSRLGYCWPITGQDRLLQETALVI